VWSLATIGSMVSIIIGVGALLAWAVTYGRTMEKNAQTTKDVDGIGRKVEAVRKDLQAQIDVTKNEHDALAREVSEIKSTTTSTLVLVEKLVSMHMQDRSEGGR